MLCFFVRFTAYGVSKVGATALTKVLAREPTDGNIKYVACCPGWVRTNMVGLLCVHVNVYGGLWTDTPLLKLPGGSTGTALARRRRGHAGAFDAGADR